MARQVRGSTLDILSAAHPQWLTFAPPGTSNHILWHAGHALWLQDVLCVELLAGRSDLPAGWKETFGMKCRPVRLTKHWPSRHELVDLLQRQLNRVVDLLDEASEELLHGPADLSLGSASVASRVIHGFHDEAKHSGEMYLLYKLARNQYPSNS